MRSASAFDSISNGRPIETLECRPGRVNRFPFGEAQERRVLEGGPRSACGRTLEGETPWEPLGEDALRCVQETGLARKGQNPGAAARFTVYRLRSVHSIRAERQVGACLGEPRSHLPSASQRSEGKAQERCEHETRLTRLGREQTVRRVTKPWRRNEGRGGSLPDQWTFQVGKC
jgi:hypothetical protein